MPPRNPAGKRGAGELRCFELIVSHPIPIPKKKKYRKIYLKKEKTNKDQRPFPEILRANGASR